MKTDFVNQSSRIPVYDIMFTYGVQLAERKIVTSEVTLQYMNVIV